MTPVTIDVDVENVVAMTPFGEIGRPPVFLSGRLLTSVEPVILVCAVDVCAAFQPGGDDSYGGVVSTATPEGFFRIYSADGSWIWELHPARFSDDEGPAVYLAVWRD